MFAVDVTIIDLAAHTAYLEPLTGTGLLLLPLAEHDIAALAQPFVGVRSSAGYLGFHCIERTGSTRCASSAGSAGSCSTTNKARWRLRDSVDGRLAMWIYGDDSVIDEPGPEEIRAALTALHIAAGIPPDRVSDVRMGTGSTR